MAFAWKAGRAGVDRAGTVALAPGLAVAAIAVVGLAGGGLERIDSLRQVAAGPSDALPEGAGSSVAGDGRSFEIERLLPSALASRGAARTGDGREPGDERHGARDGGSSRSSGERSDRAPSSSASGSSRPGAGNGGSAQAPASGGARRSGPIDTARDGVGRLTDQVTKPVQPITDDFVDGLLGGQGVRRGPIDVPRLER